MSNDFLRVGIVGCGNISGAYFSGLALYPDIVRVTACADLDPKRGATKARENRIERALSVDEIFDYPDVDLIVNLTIPGSHAAINKRALNSGKHVYSEKPFALTADDALSVVELAKNVGRRAGSAPDTFLGAGLQTCRSLVDDGAIGRPIAATAFMVGRGHESWHPDPGFYYKKGGGPMFDMGPYYLTALVDLLGPVKRVSASVTTSFATRTITSKPLRGQIIEVETPTHYSGTLDFENGAVGTVIMSFDVVAHGLPTLEIYGEDGTLSCPDPNRFHEDERIRLFRREGGDWKDVPMSHAHRAGRGLGVADMAVAVRTGREHRCSDERAAHIIEIMEAFERSSQSGAHVLIKSRCSRSTPLPKDLLPGRLD